MTLPPPPPSPEPTGSQPSRLPPPPTSGGYPYGGPPPGRKRATAAVVYGVLGLFPGCGLVLAVLAIVMGISSRKASTAAGLDASSSAKAGIALGWLGIAISVVSIVIVAVVAANSGR